MSCAKAIGKEDLEPTWYTRGNSGLPQKLGENHDSRSGLYLDRGSHYQGLTGDGHGKRGELTNTQICGPTPFPWPMPTIGLPTECNPGMY